MSIADNSSRELFDQSSADLHGHLATRTLRWTTKYWYVWIPAVLLNVVMTIDHVVAERNKKIYAVNMKTGAFRTLHNQDDDQLSESLRAHWISTNEDGDLAGRVSAIDPIQSTAIPIEQLDVSLLQQGEKIATSATDETGQFLLEDVEPGVYTLVAAGQNGFLAYGVHVLPKLQDFDDLDVNADSSKESKRSYYVSHFGLPPEVTVQEELQIDAAAVPPEFNTLERISQNYLPSADAFSMDRDTDDLTPIEKATDIKGGFQFALDENGNFNGRMQPIATASGETAKLSEMNLFLIQDDLEVARVAAEDNGKFQIEDVEPGVYSLVAAGKDGFAALSLELITGTGAPEKKLGRQRRGQTTHYVSYSPSAPANAVPSLRLAIVTDTEDLKTIQSEIKRVTNLRRKINANRFAASLRSTRRGTPSSFSGNIANAPSNPVSGAATSTTTGSATPIGVLAASAVAAVAFSSRSDDDTLDDPVVADNLVRSPTNTQGQQ